MREVTKLVGPSAGPISIVMAGVHGNEPCGLLALEKLLPTLKIEAGIVFFVIGNPNAVADNIRFTEFNLNRAFKSDSLLTNSEMRSYEYNRAQFLKRYLDHADAILDIHSSFTPGSVPFAICEANAFEIASRLPVGLVVSGFDKHQPGGTDYYMNSRGKIGICIECGYHIDPTAENIATKSILSFLRMRGHMSFPAHIFEQRRIIITELYRTKINFRVAKPWSDFEKVPSGTLIGTDGEEKIIARKDTSILFAINCNGAGEEAFLLASNH